MLSRFIHLTEFDLDTATKHIKGVGIRCVIYTLHLTNSIGRKHTKCCTHTYSCTHDCNIMRCCDRLGGHLMVMLTGVLVGSMSSRALDANSGRQHLLFSIPFSSGCANMSVAEWANMLLSVRASINGTEYSQIAAGAHVLFNVINCDGATLRNQTLGLLQAVSDTRVPVFMGWDSQVWWDQRPELWNHWNASAPGYSSSNTENVEWTNWSASSALEISWLNWGRQMRMSPAQNIHAPKVKAVTEAGLLAVAGAVASWWRASPSPEDRRLLAGIKIGCEAGIGWQTWVYPHANTIYQEHPHNSNFDPTSGGNHSAPPDPPTFGHAQIGFAAAKSAGLKTSGNLTNHDVQTLTTWYLANMTNVVTRAGVPASLLFTHYGGTLIPSGGIATIGIAPTMAYVGGELPGVALGVSLYVTPLDMVPSFGQVTRRTEGWGAVEFGLPNFHTPPHTKPGSLEAWVDGMNRTLNLHGCRLLSQLPLTSSAIAAANILINAAAVAPGVIPHLQHARRMQ